jgi:YVTN family beta-propeller protein
MEFLMTYGWAILVIAVVIGALYYLRVFSPSLPSTCVAAAPYACGTPVLSATGTLFVPIVHVGGIISVNALSCSANSTAPSSFTQLSQNIIFNSGSSRNLSFSCPLSAYNQVGTAFSGTLWIQYSSYTPQSGWRYGLEAQVGTVTATSVNIGGTSSTVTSTTVSSTSTGSSTSTTSSTTTSTTMGTTSIALPYVGGLIQVGSSPEEIAFTPGDTYAYVTNSGSGTVSVINTAGGIVVYTIPVGSSPQGIAISPASPHYAYVTNSGSGTVSVIDTSTDQVVNTIPVGSSPTGVAIGPDGAYAYVVNEGDGTVSVIDTSTDQVVDSVSVGGEPMFDAVAPGGAYLYVTNYYASAVTIISTETDTVTGFVNVGPAPLGVAFAPSGAYAYVVDQNQAFGMEAANSGARAMDLSPAPSAANVDGEAGRESLSPAGKGAQVSGPVFAPVSGPSPGYLVTIDTSTDQVVDDITIGTTPAIAALTVAGTYAYVTDTGSNNVSVINTASNSLIGTLTGFDEPYGIAIASTGSYGYVANSGSDTVSVIFTGSFNSQSVTTTTSLTTTVTTIASGPVLEMASNSSTGGKNLLNVSIPSGGYPYYLCAGGVDYGTMGYSWNSGSGYGAADSESASSVGYQTSSVCSMSGDPYLAEAVMGVLGPNPSAVYANASNGAGTSSYEILNYTVTDPGSFVVIGVACGYEQCDSVSVPSGCAVQQQVTGDGYETAYFATCPGQAAGAYSVNAVLDDTDGEASIAAYVYDQGSVSTSTTSSTSISTSTTVTTIASGPVLSIVSGSDTTGATSLGVSLPSGYPYYLCAGGAEGPITYSWNSGSSSGAADSVPVSSVGTQINNACEIDTTSDGPDIAGAIMGVFGPVPSNVYTSASNGADTGYESLSYTVTTPGSLVIIGAGCGVEECDSISVPSGCTAQQQATGDGYETAYFATCPGQAAGTYSVNAVLDDTDGAASLAAYVYNQGSVSTSTTTSSTSTTIAAVLYGIDTNSSTTSGTSLSVSLPSGYPYYLCAASGGGISSYSWNSGSGYGAADPYSYSSVGYQTSNVCEVGSSSADHAEAIMGVNAMLPDAVYTNTANFGSSQDLSYTVSKWGGFVVLTAACQGNYGDPCSAVSFPYGCVVQRRATGPDGYEGVAMATCSDQYPGSYEVSVGTWAYGISLAAYIYDGGGSV